jgi:hypothetical protein
MSTSPLFYIKMRAPTHLWTSKNVHEFQALYRAIGLVFEACWIPLKHKTQTHIDILAIFQYKCTWLHVDFGFSTLC